jgi:hypothetical protein
VSSNAGICTVPATGETRSLLTERMSGGTGIGLPVDTAEATVMPEFSDSENRQTAQEIERQHPGWIVIWGAYSQQYVAFPKFRVPPGNILTAGYPPALAERMRAVESRAQRRRHSRRIDDEPGGG